MKLLFLHGALGAGEQMLPLAQMLSDKCEVDVLSFSGHGTRNLNGNNFSIALFVNDVLQYMLENDIEKASFCGYSMGGYIAMYIARHHPDKVDKIITLATKYEWDDGIAAREVKMLDSEKILEKLPHFAATLSQRHTGIGWKQVLTYTAAMMRAMGSDNPLKFADYAIIPHKVLVALGDRDRMVSMEETISIYKALPNAQLCIIPDTGHPIEQLDVNLAATIVNRFLSQ